MTSENNMKSLIRLEKPRRVNVTPRGSYTVCVPKPWAEAHFKNIIGKVYVDTDSQGRLILTPIKRNEPTS